ncbi:hypothetical protein SAG0169_10540 [Streptococcus agalactiae LDS 610]|nr:hypothetical protein FSLSAGS3026_02419 [Streptococcus agalactiae FSL S3-026]EPV85790.1 hypothetical protein SAG0014_01720 [Streptococcus agalactiae FSL S3-586]EPX17168.1 hypothetical protein SAG0169_10540 [Streptococcus agalactiae LDS 610]KLL26278.1 hypothetical protein WA01_09790 [Streptococcus agalactiae]
MCALFIFKSQSVFGNNYESFTKIGSVSKNMKIQLKNLEKNSQKSKMIVKHNC